MIREKENELFAKWKAELKVPSAFIPDGVVDETLWSHTPKRVLYLLKEVNGGENWDERHYLAQYDIEEEYKKTHSPSIDSLARWQLGLNLVLLVIMFFCDKSLIGAGTILNMVLIGYTADFCHWLERISGFEAFVMASLPLRIGVFAVALILFVISAAVYMNTQMGLSPYDGLCKIIPNKLYRLPFAPLRMAYDGLAVLIGVVAGTLFAEKMTGSAIGAVFMVFLLGPAISAIGKWMQKRFAIFREE